MRWVVFQLKVTWRFSAVNSALRLNHLINFQEPKIIILCILGWWADSNKETDDACDGVSEGYRRQRKGLCPDGRDEGDDGGHGADLMTSWLRQALWRTETVTALRHLRRASVLRSMDPTVQLLTGLSPTRASWSPVSGSGKSRIWTRRSPGWSAAPIPCQDRARSKSARYTRCLI